MTFTVAYRRPGERAWYYTPELCKVESAEYVLKRYQQAGLEAERCTADDARKDLRRRGLLKGKRR